MAFTPDHQLRDASLGALLASNIAGLSEAVRMGAQVEQMSEEFRCYAAAIGVDGTAAEDVLKQVRAKGEELYRSGQWDVGTAAYVRAVFAEARRCVIARACGTQFLPFQQWVEEFQRAYEGITPRPAEAPRLP